MESQQYQSKNQLNREKKAIISLIIGIICILASVGGFFGETVARFLAGTSERIVIYFSIFLPLSSFGIILSGISLKSSKKKKDIRGIIFSVIALILSMVALIRMLFVLLIVLASMYT